MNSTFFSASNQILDLNRMALENIFYRFCGQYPLIIYPIYSIIQELPAHKRQVNGVKFSCDAKRVVSCGSDFYMKVIDLQTGTILFSKGKLPMYFLFKGGLISESAVVYLWFHLG